jgi:hypothetical protein
MARGINREDTLAVLMGGIGWHEEGAGEKRRKKKTKSFKKDRG